MNNTLFGFIAGFVAMGVLLCFALHTCCDNSVSNYALNNPKYKIDTIVTVHNGDTTYTYKFAKKMTDEEIWLEEYKSRADFYKKFIEYLSEECVGNKDSIIEAVNTNFRNEFMGYVDTEKEIDNKGNLIFKFKIDDKTYKANWQEDDNYAVCQWTGYEVDDYMGYLLFPTFGFKKFFCIYYTC